MKQDGKVGVSKQTVATVTKGFRSGNQDSSTETLQVRTFVAPHAEVRFGGRATLNLGNYESATVEVMICVPCYLEEVEDAYRFAKEWTEAKLEAETDDIRSHRPGKF